MTALTDRERDIINKSSPAAKRTSLGTRVQVLEGGVVPGAGTEAQIAICDTDGAPKYKTISGDITVSKLGVTAIGTDKVTALMVKDGDLTNAHLSASAAIATSKMAGADHSTVGVGKLPKLAIGEFDIADAVTLELASATDIANATDTFTYTAHGLTAGAVCNVTTSDALPTGLAVDTAYYVGELTADTFKLYDTRAHAVAGGETGLVNITSDGTGTQTFMFGVGIGQHYLGVTLPDNALIVGGGVEVLTTMADGVDDSATIALSIKTANDLVTATAISAGGNLWDAGNHDIVPDNTGSTAIKLSAISELLMTVAVKQVAAGKLRVWLMYIEGI